MTGFDVFKVPLAGVHLIDASAGTGKTHTISDLVLRLLVEEGVAIRDILIVTFTEAATKELREKVRARIIEARQVFAQGEPADSPFYERLLAEHPDRGLVDKQLLEALRGFDEAAVFTIHGFCQRMLWENNLETGTLFDTELITDETPLLQEIVEDFVRTRLYGAGLLFVQFARTRLAPERLRGLLARHLNRPGLAIVPVLSVEEARHGLVELEERYHRLYDEVQQEWPQQVAQLVRLLQGEAMSRNSYRPASVEKWAAALSALFGQVQPTVMLPAEFERFTADRVAGAVRKGQAKPEHPLFAICGELWQLKKTLEERYAQVVIALKAELFSYARLERQRRKGLANVHSFDDLLSQLHDSLVGHAGGKLAAAIRKRFPVAMIDEFQDTDSLQYGIFHQIYGSGRGLLFFIGDPKQSIYSFRGADIFTYMQAAAGASTRYTLGENWRSAPELIRAVNTIFSRSGSLRQPFWYDGIAFSEVAPAPRRNRQALALDGLDPAPMQLWMVERLEPGKPLAKDKAALRICRAVAAEVVRLLRLGANGRARIGEAPLRAGDIAILVRKNRQARQLQTVLGEFGVAAVLHSSGNLLDSHEAAELAIVLQGVTSPDIDRYLKAALATDMLQVDGCELDLFAGSSPELERLRAEFHRCQGVWRQHGFIRMFRSLLDHLGVRERLLGYENGERRITNVLHLMELLHRVERERGAAPVQLLQYLLDRGDGDGEPEELQLRLESDAERVKIVTIHKSKGLQYPVVFCPFNWEGPVLKPDAEEACHVGARQDALLDLGSDLKQHHLELARREQLAEDIRLLYVALTRAEHRCYLCWGGMGGAEFSALDFLLHAGAVASEYTGRLASMDDQAILADLEALAAAAAGSIAVRRLAGGDGEVLGADLAGEPPHLSCREFKALLDRKWQITSFSGLTATAHRAPQLTPGFDDQTRRFTQAIDADEDGGESSAFVDFPRGAAPGTFLHEVLEQLDFTWDREERAGFIGAKLTSQGYDPVWRGPLASMVESLLAAELPQVAPAFRLGGLGAGQRKTEMEFYFPLREFGADALAEFFRHRYPAGPFADFADRLSELGSWRLQGYLKGFIDLIFEHRGRYYIVDWKSNFLGRSLDAYRRPHLDRVMGEELYLLQYHLYLLAVHRYLGRRVANYSYDRHVGGVFYIFLRGLAPGGQGDGGIFFDRPSRECIRDFEQMLSPPLR